jgi:hypothetical protein
MQLQELQVNETFKLKDHIDPDFMYVVSGRVELKFEKLCDQT